MIRAAALGAALALCAAAVPHQARAHGTGWRVTDEKAVTVELYYADGAQMPFADVKVFAPGDEKVPVLHGRADARGRVAFVPDRGGIWTVTAVDGEGHSVNAPVSVTLDAVVPVTSGRVPLEVRLILFASVLANVALSFLAWWLLSGTARPAHRARPPRRRPCATMPATPPTGAIKEAA